MAGIFQNLPYTNFHELNLDWVIEKVRETMAAWEDYKTSMDEWKLGVDDELAEFQAWFDNLDVQDEVRTVINELILSGEFIEITSPQIVSATEAWLAAHITPTTPAVDDTLSISGAAADAKVTGDRVSDLKKDLDDEIHVRILLSGKVATAESDIDTLETHKVAQPLDEHNQPTNGTDGQSLRTKGDGTTEWAEVGLPTDEQTAQAVSAWLDDHPEATTTVQDGSLTDVKFAQSVKDEINFTRSVYSMGGINGVLESPQLGTYTGNTITIDSTIDITDNDVGDQFKTIADTRIFLNADMFTWDLPHRGIPTFINCLFWGNGNNIVADGMYISEARFINCIFYNCGLINNANYVQGVTFIGCRFVGNNDFITTKCCGGISVIGCQAESDFNGAFLVADSLSATNKNTLDHICIVNSVFEGNSNRPIIECNNTCEIQIDGCYFEGYPHGIIATSESDNGCKFLLKISDTKMWECGDPILTIDQTYGGNVHVSIDSCRLASATSKNLANRYDFDNGYISNSVLENIYCELSNGVISKQFQFDESTMSATLQLQPMSLYLITQARKTYTGIVIYAVTTDTTGIYSEKIIDPNNRWTITDEGNLTITITSNAYGIGRLVKL